MRELLTSELDRISGGLRLDSGPQLHPDVYCPYCGQGGTGHPNDENTWFTIGPSSFNDGYWVPPSPVPDVITVPTPYGDSASVGPASINGEPGLGIQVTASDGNKISGGIGLGGAGGDFSYTIPGSNLTVSGEVSLNGSGVTNADLTLTGTW